MTDTIEIHRYNVAVCISVSFSVHNIIDLRNKRMWIWNFRHSITMCVVTHGDSTYYRVDHLNQMY
jgi:hypothetical protein